MSHITRAKKDNYMEEDDFFPFGLDDDEVPRYRKKKPTKDNSTPYSKKQQEEVVARIMRYAGKQIKDMRNPNLTVRDTIALADYFKVLVSGE